MKMRAIATGNFDGVHLGHARIFEVMQQWANQINLEPLVVAYAPHTRHILGKAGEPTLLTPLAERQQVVEKMGYGFQDLPFSRELSQLSGLEFVRQIIVGELRAQAWIFGEDHRFGYKGQGDIMEVQQAFPQLKIVRVPPVVWETQNISSSRIREALSQGHLADANSMLGRNYSLQGMVVHGEKRGRTIGFPTANLEVPLYKHLPAFGVYAGMVYGHDLAHRAVVNIGNRPTFNGAKPSIEIHIPQWSGDLYGKSLEMKLDLRLRGEMRFESLEELKTQIACDVQRALSTK